MGMSQAVAKELVTDANKLLCYAGKGELQVAHLYDTKKVRQYLFKSEKDGIHSSGQLVKLSHISTALLYASSMDKWIDDNLKPKRAVPSLE